MVFAIIWVTLGLLGQGNGGSGEPVKVVVPFVEDNEVDLSELIARLAEATKLDVVRPKSDVTLPITGVAGNLSRKMLNASLGPEVLITIEGRSLVLRIDPVLLTTDHIRDWESRVKNLAREAAREARRRTAYGIHALKSYRPNDPTRPTVCLVHGVNSSSGGFVHMIRPIEEAGYGVVMFDYPYNRSLEESCERFAHDLRAFRTKTGETRPWALVGHSMGALVVRDFVERPEYQPGEVSTLILVAPVNQGSYLAKTQTLLQWIHGLQAVHGRRTSDALAHLGDGLGEAARDMTPGSQFLRRLNARPRQEGVSYHILAGDVGVLTAAGSARSRTTSRRQNGSRAFSGVSHGSRRSEPTSRNGSTRLPTAPATAASRSRGPVSMA